MTTICPSALLQMHSAQFSFFGDDLFDLCYNSLGFLGLMVLQFYTFGLVMA